MPMLKDRVVVLVDDGLASSYTMLVAAGSVKKCAPAKLVVATPTGADPRSLDTPRHGYHAMEKKGIMELEVTA